FYRELLDVRRQFIRPHMKGVRSLGVQELGKFAVLAAWELGNGSVLRLYCNLSSDDADSQGDVSVNEVILFSTPNQADGILRSGRLPAASMVATIEAASEHAAPRSAE